MITWKLHLTLTLDLTGHKENQTDLRYTNAKSNHPSSILRQITAAISKRISTNSLNKQIFQNAAPYYNNILKKRGYKEKIQFQQCEHQKTQSRRNRSRKTVWVNPPCRSNVKTNADRNFLKVVKSILANIATIRYLMKAT